MSLKWHWNIILKKICSPLLWVCCGKEKPNTNFPYVFSDFMQVTLRIYLKLQVLWVNYAPHFWYFICTKQSLNFVCQMWHELIPIRTKVQNNAKWTEVISHFHGCDIGEWVFPCASHVSFYLWLLLYIFLSLLTGAKPI